MIPTHAWFAAEAAWWWPRIADHLWQTTLFALLIFAATSSLRRGSAKVRHAFWILASLKLLIPAAFFVFLVERAGIDLGSIIDRALGSGRDAAMFQTISEPVSMISSTYQLTVFAGNAAHHDEFYCALSIIWLIGGLRLLFTWADRRRKFPQALKRGRRVHAGREAEIFERAKSSLGLTSPVSLVLAPCRTEPAVARVWKPVVMLPESICEQLNDQELEAIMLHELVHVERRDNLVGNLQMMVCAFLWFYPPVWLISRKLINEREEACDERVMKVGAIAEAYASSILKVLRFSFGWKVAGVSGVGNGSNLRRRIKNIMSSNGTKRSATSSRIFAGLLAGLAVMLVIAAGVGTRAHNSDFPATQAEEQASASLYQRIISTLAPTEQRSARRKPQPPPPPPPAQPSQPAQLSPPPPPPAQPAQPAQPTQATAPSAPPASLVPAAQAPIAISTTATPATPASAPVPPAQEKKPESPEDEREKVDKGNLIEAPHPVYPNEENKIFRARLTFQL